MASFYKRKLKNGEVWYANLILADGRRKSINTKCETKAAAKDVAAEFERKILLGLDPTKPEPPKQNVLALFERFIQDETRNWSGDTVAMYKDTLSILTESVGPIALADLSRKHRNQVVDFLQERGAVLKTVDGKSKRLREISPHTINRHLRNVTRFLNWCIEEEIQKGWQPPRFKSLPIVPEPRESFTPDELTRILETAASFKQNDQPVQLYFAFLAFSGFRRNEALHLQWSDIDFDRQLILVPPGKVTKRTQKRETVPITAPLAAILRNLPNRAEGRVFPGLSEEVSDTFKAACEAAGVRYRPLHRLRATFATQLSTEGLPPMAVQRMARHAKVETTHDWYYQPERDALREAADTALIGSAFETAILRILGK